jgi:hypothetical protein
MSIQELENYDPSVDPRDNPNDANRPDSADDRPHTPDDEFKDQGRETANDSDAEAINREELPELNHEGNEDDKNGLEGYKPTAFDIDESTG